MKENSIRRAVREGRAALGTGLKEFASRGVPRIIVTEGVRNPFDKVPDTLIGRRRRADLLVAIALLQQAVVFVD